MPRYSMPSRPLFVVLALLLGACGGVDGDAGDVSPDGGGASTAAATSTPASASEATPEVAVGSSGAADVSTEDLDVCSLVTQDEVSAVIGTQAGAAQPEDDPGLSYFGCRYEEDGITAGVNIGVWAFPDESEARSFFEFGYDEYPAVEGIGDDAYRSQPLGEITVLDGRYEVDVFLFFVSEDEDEEFEMARELAQMVLDRLP